MRRLPYILLDVFADTALTGNQLAVYTDARGLSDDEMQRLAKEMNLSETTFIVPRDEGLEREQGIKVRIFTVQEELPFAGHPTLGTANVLRERAAKLGSPNRVVLDLNVGQVPVTFEQRDGNLVFGEMKQRDPEIGGLHDRETISRLTGVPLADYDENLPIQTFSTGLPYAIVPLKSLAAAQRLRFKFTDEVDKYLKGTGSRFFYWVTRETTSPDVFLHARMIFYNGEDPATGSAGGCCASWMAHHGVAPSGKQVVIEQGVEIGRPSRLFVRAEKAGDKVINVHVGGYCVEIARGEVAL